MPSSQHGSKTMRWLPLAIFVAVAVLLGAGVWLSRKPGRDALPSPLIGKPAPAFSLPVLQDPGRMVSLADFKGAPFVLNVWASWCPACRQEHDAITRLAQSKRVRVIGYNWQDDRSEALRWLNQFGNPYSVIVADRDSRYALDWGIYGAPETFLVDSRGIVRWKYVGALSNDIVERELLPALAQAEQAR